MHGKVSPHAAPREGAPPAESAPGQEGEKCIRELRCRPHRAGSGMDAVLRRRVGRVCAQTEWNRGPAVSEQETAGLLTYRKLREIPCDGH